MITTKFEVREDRYGDNKLVVFVEHIIRAAEEIADMNRGKRVRVTDRFRVLLDGRTYGYGRKKSLRALLKKVQPGRECVVYSNKGGAMIHFDAGPRSGRFEAVPKAQEPSGTLQGADLAPALPSRPSRYLTISRNTQVDVDIDALRASDPLDTPAPAPEPAVPMLKPGPPESLPMVGDHPCPYPAPEGWQWWPAAAGPILIPVESNDPLKHAVRPWAGDPMPEPRPAAPSTAGSTESPADPEPEPACPLMAADPEAGDDADDSGSDPAWV